MIKDLDHAFTGLAFSLGLALVLAGGSAAAVNPGVAEIDHPDDYTRIVAVSDVHGMYKPLLKLLKNARLIDSANNWSGGKTLFVIIGDSINKGPESVETIDLFMSLQKQAPAQGGRVIHLLGNHEAEFLADPKGGGKMDEFRDELKAKDIRIREFTHPGFPRADFMLSMPVAARVGKWLFCHSGMLPDQTWSQFAEKAGEVVRDGNYGSNFLLGPDSILENDAWWDDKEERKELKTRLSDNGLFGVVFGHRGAALGAEGRIGISDGGRFIKLDTGMAPEGGGNKGSLLVFPNPVELSSAAPATVLTSHPAGPPRPLKP